MRLVSLQVDSAPFQRKNGHPPASVYIESLDWLDLGEARPVTFFIDREGVLREYLLGGRDYEFFERKVRKYLN